MSAPSLILENAALVLPDRVIDHGWIAVSEGVIAEIGEGRPPERGIDCGGDHVIPGLVELHTDNLESHYAPRPSVRWHPLSAVMAYDAQIAAAGITTVFDSLRLGSDADSGSLGNDLWTLADAIAEANASGLLRAEHKTHLRCEISSLNVLEQAGTYFQRYCAQMMSLMDHTPGQRQFTSIAIWKRYYQGKTTYTDAELDAFIERRLEAHRDHAAAHRAGLVAHARAHGVVLASHDDATAGHVDEAIEDGVAIAEFPTTKEAAIASHAKGLKVLMGGPNVVRGGSHSGNIAAEDLARDGVLDILSSDYVPASLLMAAFELPRRVPSITLPEAMRTVTLNPAIATGLTDRGALEPGLRGDLVRVAAIGEKPVAREVFREGRRVA